MSKLQLLNAYVTERLTAAATEISVAIETTVVELHEEISRSTEENDRLRRLLDLVFNRQIKLHRDPHQLTLPKSEEEVPSVQQHCEEEWSPSLIQEDPELTQIKEEQEELRTNQEEEQLQALGEADLIKFIFPPACVKNVCDQENPSQPSHLHQTQTVEDRERDSLLTYTTEEIKTEPDGEDYRVSEPTSDSPPLSAVNPDCSAAQSENRESDDEERGGLLSGSKTLKSMTKQTKNGERFHTSAGGRTETMLPCLTSSSQTDAAPYCCKVCRKTFVSNGFLIYHVRKTHTEHKECQCGVCGKCLNSTESMMGHLQTHTEENISCHVCGKCFSKSGDLKTHIRSHTGEKPYQCTQCSKCYTQKVHLKNHIRTHTGEKPFRCKECGKYFTQKNTLSNHMMIHRGEKPYQCKTCGKRFTESGTLSRHIRVHTGEKPHQCQECGKCFTERGNLTKHIKIHRRERSYYCSYCSICFTDEANCKRHMNTVHKSENI
ncbi:zinc finger and SCAN domain-containing protein 12 [Coregonus clupeaformis]|uniref:zinc finger and SCAN domain-containing protein 12 n=1 Tax=Coregonus clupeaformis TaxID=59861 RepID=UPI001BE0AEB6|nr:zinc finger and SCAN domain-containing protein 12 [Coregonus clupeaformis]